MFQLLYYMGFSKVIVVGYGDKGESEGYEKLISSGHAIPWTWSSEEIHAMVTHHQIWGDKLKCLHGGEICKSYVDFKTAQYTELETTPTKKEKLVKKLLKL